MDETLQFMKGVMKKLFLLLILTSCAFEVPSETSEDFEYLDEEDVVGPSYDRGDSYGSNCGSVTLTDPNGLIIELPNECDLLENPGEDVIDPYQGIIPPVEHYQEEKF